MQPPSECFDYLDSEVCNTTIPEVFTPKYKGPNINKANSQFILFTPKNEDKAEPLHRCGGKLPKGSLFDPDLSTVVIAHGWLDGVCRTAWMREMKTQLFLRGNFNVILTDWTWGNTVDYSTAALNSLVVGEQTAFVIKNIMKQTGIKGKKFHLIGHSFGAYQVGYAAKIIKGRNKKNMIGRVTHLDPAYAPFAHDMEKISYKNAKFVDVIHSNGGNCFPQSTGVAKAVGHADFYPNGGVFQPSCYPYAFISLLKLDLFYGLFGLLLPQFCSHLQSIQYFKASINPSGQKFIGVECDNYENFLSGNCKQCCESNTTGCAVAGMDADYYFAHHNESRRERKYFFNTKVMCPYFEDNC